MSTLMGSLLRQATKPVKERLNILTCPTHERYESLLCKCNANFYAYRGDNIKDWDNIYAIKPDNYQLLPRNGGMAALPIDIEFDAVLSQNKFGQYPILKQFADQLHLPLICLEHTLPYDTWSQTRIDQMKSMKGHINIFISGYSRERWGWKPDEATVIHHGIDTELFSPGLNRSEEPTVLSVVNDFINRDQPCGYKLWEETTFNLGKQRVILGNTPGLSEPAKSIDDLVQAYRNCQVFLNTSLISPIPTVLLEAMSCGRAVVSTNTCMIPTVIKHGVNGFLGRSPDELRYYVNKLLRDEDLANSLGKAARQTILQSFSADNFIGSWNAIFDVASNIIYKGSVA